MGECCFYSCRNISRESQSYLNKHCLFLVQVSGKKTGLDRQIYSLFFVSRCIPPLQFWLYHLVYQQVRITNLILDQFP